MIHSVSFNTALTAISAASMQPLAGHKNRSSAVPKDILTENTTRV